MVGFSFCLLIFVGSILLVLWLAPFGKQNAVNIGSHTYLQSDTTYRMHYLNGNSDQTAKQGK